MKWNKIIIGLALGCIWQHGMAQLFSIQGYLQHVPDGVVLELLADKPFGYEVLAKDSLKDGMFYFQDSVPKDYPRLLLRAQGKLFPKVLLPVWVAPGEKIQIEGRNRLVQHWKVKSNLPEQTVENRFIEVTRRESQAKMQAMLARHKWMDERMKHEGDRAFQLRATQALDSLKFQIDSLGRVIARKEFALLKETSVSPAWYYHYRHVATQIDQEKDTAYVAQVKALYERVPEKVRMTPIGAQIAAHVYIPPKVQVEEPMADGVLFDLKGNMHQLAEFKGKYILLDFWSSRCSACMAAIPELKEVAERYKDKLEVVSFFSGNVSDWKCLVAKYHMEGNQWSDLQQRYTGLCGAYQVWGFPTFFVISPKGEIIKTWSGYPTNGHKGTIDHHLKETFQE